MSEIVERVARAIHDAAERHDEHEIDVVAWERTTENNRARSRQLARAAIEAMREPTVKMNDAGMDANPRGRTVSDTDLDTMYRAMIDASLNEGEAER